MAVIVPIISILFFPFLKKVNISLGYISDKVIKLNIGIIKPELVKLPLKIFPDTISLSSKELLSIYIFSKKQKFSSNLKNSQVKITFKY